MQAVGAEQRHPDTSASGARPNRQCIDERRYTTVLIFGVALVFAWVLWTSYWDSGLYGDNIEQFVWSHSMEWGYAKHPPLPTWLMGLAIWLIGPHWWLANGLAALCFAVTGVLTWLIAQRLCGTRVANTTIVLWGLQQCFSVSAEIYNHNTVLVMCLAATTYSVMRGLCSRFGSAWWLLSGAFAGLAMLAKYQAALPLAALVVVVLRVGRSRVEHLARKMTLAFLVSVLLLVPHLYWSIVNQFPSLRYASTALESGGVLRRLSWILTFIVNQVRMVFPQLLAIGLAISLSFGLARWTRGAARPQPVNPTPQADCSPAEFDAREVNIWMWSLVWGPALLLVVMSLITGSVLRNHWGVQIFQFLSMWIAWRWSMSPSLRPKELIILALLVHAMGLTYYAIKQSDPRNVLSERRADSAYPAQRLSDAALMHWKSLTACPLRFVAGDFEAGLVSAFSPEFPVVYTSPLATPWVNSADLAKHGVLHVLDQNAGAPAEASPVVRWPLSSGPGGLTKYVQFAVQQPSAPCPVPSKM